MSVSPDTRFHVYRGGAFDDSAAYARSAYRSYFTPVSRNVNLGLRPAKSIAP